MWELWVKTNHGWLWRAIGAVDKLDLINDIEHAFYDETVVEMRVISDVAQRPGVVA